MMKKMIVVMKCEGESNEEDEDMRKGWGPE
jgi:hypothetical protein